MGDFLKEITEFHKKHEEGMKQQREDDERFAKFCFWLGLIVVILLVIGAFQS